MLKFIHVAVIGLALGFGIGIASAQTKAEVYNTKMGSSINFARIEQAKFCPQPRSFDTKQCNADYEQLVAALGKEQEIGAKYLASLERADGKAASMKKSVSGAAADSNRLLTLTQTRYYLPEKSAEKTK